ncbi:Extracellular metalloprotease SMAC_06893 [Rhizoctonia solani]|uniref:Extracellular metalloprotease SMAC_06893 n=1 Tax=Rhizoctonia solani TaxID=456999 RepID=A0A0K6FM54_9AGAM|nr:Extracellular metalloprotease SMAC_06893 [Rhizoctonia solani]
MVSFVRFLTSALTLATLSLALPANNATVSITDPVHLVCGADRPPRTGLPKADESRLAPSMVITASVARTIKVYWNVIHKDTTYAGGYLSSNQVNSAISALNSHFAGSGLTFKRVALKYTKNAQWFDNVDNEDNNDLATAMKSRLHMGTAKDLNVYSVGFTNSNLGGFATFPWWYSGAPKLDGVVFKWNTTPGGTLANYNQGKIFSHEVGHWVGLYHTFQGGCSDAQGDYVSDTPAEASPATGCPVNRDSCPNLAGKDPIRNHMDYTYDTCKNGKFTNGQITRMGQAMQAYRAN